MLSDRDPLGLAAYRESVREQEDSPAMRQGDTVIYVGCGHEDPCPELARPCSVTFYGAMTIWLTRPDGLLTCELGDGTAEVFHPRELDSPEAVAARALEGEAHV
jgi:hypothetical protein